MQDQEVPSLEHSLYGELYRRYAPELFAYAFQHTTSREVAEDIVLDVFLSVLQNQPFLTFDEQKQARWLWTITRNKVVDRYRHSVRHPHVSLEWLTEPLYEDGSLAPEAISLKQEEYTQLYNALHRLPKLQQEVLRLRFGHLLKCGEIASLLGKGEGAVRMLLFRALQRLRHLYQNQGKGGQA